MSNRNSKRADDRVLRGRSPVNPALFRRDRDVVEEANQSQQTGKIVSHSRIYEGIEGSPDNRRTVFSVRVIPPQEVVDPDAVWGSSPTLRSIIQGPPSEMFRHYPPEVTLHEQTLPAEDDPTDMTEITSDTADMIENKRWSKLIPKSVRNPNHVRPDVFVNAVQEDVQKEWGNSAFHPVYHIPLGFEPRVNIVKPIYDGELTVPRGMSDEDYVDFDEGLGDVKIPVTSPRHRKENYKLSSQFDDHLDEDNQTKLPGMD